MRQQPSSRHKRDISVNYLRHLLKVGVSLGIAEHSLLQDLHLSPALLDSLDGRVSIHLVEKVTQRMIKLSQRDDIGMMFGMLIRPTSHGFLGYAVMSCDTFADSMRVLHKYLSLHLDDITIDLASNDSDIVLTLSENYNFGSMRQVFYEAFLTACCQHIAYLIGRLPDGVGIKTDWAKPTYFDDYAERMPPWSFNQARIQIHISKSVLKLPLVMTDPAVVKHALVQMDKTAANRLLVMTPDYVPRVRALLQPNADTGYPNLKTMAAALSISERTLKRRLNEAGTNFQSLLNDARQRQATELILEGQLSMQQIAQTLGYTDPATFTRAYKRWTGRPPSDLRMK